MALPSAYLTSTKNVTAILDAIAKAQAPSRFTQKFLEGLGFPSSTDRLMINVLKSLGFLSETGEPTQRYHQYLDRSLSKSVLAEGVREAYADLFQINTSANDMTRADLKNKMKTLSQGQHSDSVLDKMAMTFKALVDASEWSHPAASANRNSEHPKPVLNQPAPDPERPPSDSSAASRAKGIDGLVYNLNIHLPESRDPAVYDALFRSLREHLL